MRGEPGNGGRRRYVALMGLPLADRWFERQTISDDVTLFVEPHVIELMRCNIWHVRGRDRDLVVDTGMGVASLVDAMADLLDKPVTAVATHGHGDHVGGHHEFDDVIAHPAEAAAVESPELQTLDPLEAWGPEALDGLRRAGYDGRPRLLRDRPAARRDPRELRPIAGDGDPVGRRRRCDRSR